MAEFTKKWKTSFEKKYSKAVNTLRELEAELKEMKDSNPDLWYELNYFSIDEPTLEFNNAKNLGIYHSKETDETPEYIEIGVDGSEASSLAFKFYSLKELIQFRNKLTESIDEFKRPLEEEKELITDDCEEEEGWEDNEEQEYTIQASRTCVQSWTHTVMARSVCEAYRKAKDGEGHDENDDLDQYGEIDWEDI
jgi:hypothetical protein